jgi:ABC-type glycerol-3-phosphate transport system substrate-binding protein
MEIEMRRDNELLRHVKGTLTIRSALSAIAMAACLMATVALADDEETEITMDAFMDPNNPIQIAYEPFCHV